MNNVNRSHLDEAVDLEASERFGTVGSDALLQDFTRHAVTVNSDGAATAGKNTDVVDQPALADQTLVVDAAALTVSGVSSDGISAVRGISYAVPNTAIFNPLSSHKPRLLPPMAFLSRADGTPFTNTAADHGQESEFGQQGTTRERDRISLDTQALCDSKLKDAATDLADECSEELENECDHMADLLRVRKTLRAFADNKNKLKYVSFFLQLLMS